ncbi:hypothetical protein NF865_10170 [Thermococcus aggregans]|uniref:Uncharacterized protein n=1 Tax=Thermococcus aggregans TaxID=110163 RepID=A0A9E7SNS5_THEAG|nr:hypothetical protein [Thermococcus aggregans]USS40631.1 hypothetical protein NF865_10170 [Thermococcus aggregans]
MKLREALQEYERKKEEIKKQRQRIRAKYTKTSGEIVLKIFKNLERLEKQEIPKNVDPRLARIVKAEKDRYITALRNMLQKIEGIEDVEKILPEISRFHVTHGRHLLLIFEKEIYEINALLKALSEEYSAYLKEVGKIGIEDVKTKELLKELEDLRDTLKEEELSRENLMKQLEELQKQIKGLEAKPEFKALRESQERLKREISGKEINIRSKISKLQKPIKRMRLPESVAREFLKDSAYAINHPEEFLELLGRIENELDKKYKKTAEWAKTNLIKESQELANMKEELAKVEKELSDIVEKEEAKKREVEELKRKIREKEEKIKAFKKKVEELEEELKRSISKLERILGEKVETS